MTAKTWKPEDIPSAMVLAAWFIWDGSGDMAAVIAAALNAMPGQPPDALREELARQESPTTGYVQTVPDKCDRIVWRGSYFHLPIAPQPVRVPDGWRLVPVKPTIEMEDAANRVDPRHNHNIYVAMLAAAPRPKDQS